MNTLNSKNPDNLFNFYSESFFPNHFQKTNGIYKGSIGLEPRCEVEIVHVDNESKPMDLTIYLDDIDDYKHSLEIPKYGARIISNKEDKGSREEMTIEDPDGNIVLLINRLYSSLV